MTAIFSNIGLLVTNAVSWMGDFLGSITDNSVLTLFCIALPLVGLGVGLLRRLIHTRG